MSWREKPISVLSELISQLRILVKKKKEKKTYSCVHDLTNRFVSTILKIAVGVGERK